MTVDVAMTVLLAVLAAAQMTLVRRLGRGPVGDDSRSGLVDVSDSVGRAPADGRSTLLLFLSPSCGSCRGLLENLDSIAREVEPSVIVRPALEGGEHGLADALFSVYDIPGTPYGVVLGHGGRRVAESPIFDAQDVIELGRRAASSEPQQVTTSVVAPPEDIAEQVLGWLGSDAMREAGTAVAESIQASISVGIPAVDARVRWEATGTTGHVLIDVDADVAEPLFTGAARRLELS